MYAPLLLCLVLASTASLSLARMLEAEDPMADPEWRDYKLKFGKFYSKSEESSRYQTWCQNKKDITEHNLRTKTYYKGLNNFTDMTHKEFKEQMGGCYRIPQHLLDANITSSGEGSTFMPPCNVELPAEVNWVTKGYVTPVKNQGQCGSCYSFSTTGALEGQMFRKNGRLPLISEQNIVDCSTKYGNYGCRGGWMDYAFKYIHDNGGIDSETGYPYYARELGYCYYQSNYNIADVSGFVDVGHTEAALKVAVATIGPISVAIDATHPSFMQYKSGVYFEQACGNTIRSLDHAVLVVGYGTEGGYDYWLVKNSWGTYWGDGGYIKMARNYNNQCGIACKPSYPLV